MSRPPKASHAVAFSDRDAENCPIDALTLAPYHGRNMSMSSTSALMPATISPKLILDVSSLLAAATSGPLLWSRDGTLTPGPAQSPRDRDFAGNRGPGGDRAAGPVHRRRATRRGSPVAAPRAAGPRCRDRAHPRVPQLRDSPRDPRPPRDRGQRVVDQLPAGGDAPRAARDGVGHARPDGDRVHRAADHRRPCIAERDLARGR